jgi:hypothetical protein
MSPTLAPKISAAAAIRSQVRTVGPMSVQHAVLWANLVHGRQAGRWLHASSTVGAERRVDVSPAALADHNQPSKHQDDQPHHTRGYQIRRGPRWRCSTRQCTSCIRDCRTTPQARAAAGGRDIRIRGGADLIQQYLNAGMVNEFTISLAPVVLGVGTRLFDCTEFGKFALALVDTVPSPRVTHLRFATSRAPVVRRAGNHTDDAAAA